MTYKEEKELERANAAKLYKLAIQIKDQRTLNCILIDIQNRRKRAIAYEILRPIVSKRFTPEYPDVIAEMDDYTPISQSASEVSH